MPEIAERAFVNSLPKSGTNLVQKLVELLGFGYSRRSVAASSLHGRYQLYKRILRSPWFERNPTPIGIEASAVVSSSWLERYVSATPSGQYLTGHAAYSDFLDFVVRREGIPVLQVIRDPRDVALSWVEYIVEPQNTWAPFHAHFSALSRDERVRFLVSGGYAPSAGLYFNSLKSILRAQEGWFERPHVLPVRFEDLVGSEGGGSADRQVEMVGTIAKFFGRENAPVEAIAQQIYGGTSTFRVGAINRAHNALSQELLELIDESIEGIDYLRRLGYVTARP